MVYAHVKWFYGFGVIKDNQRFFKVMFCKVTFVFGLEVFSKIDAETGLLPIPESKKTIFECFKEGSVPTEYTKEPNSMTEPEQFFKSDM